LNEVVPNPTSNPESIPSNFDADILLVEDNPINKKLMTMMLTSFGCRVHTAERNAEALDILSTKKVDLILTDWFLMEDTCEEMLKTLLTRKETPPPIICITGDSTLDFEEKLKGLGVREVLMKADSKAVIKGALARHLSQ